MTTIGGVAWHSVAGALGTGFVVLAAAGLGRNPRSLNLVVPLNQKKVAEPDANFGPLYEEP